MKLLGCFLGISYFHGVKLELLIKRLEVLELRVANLEKRNISLKKENIVLKERLSKYETQKNSRNSSIAPSKDENRPKANQSLRKPSGKKPGGQKGREGKTLEMTSTPDKIVELYPNYCRSCGSSLDKELAIKEQSRQVIDIPPIKAIFIEYQAFSTLCSCGCKNVADFPKTVLAPVSYGSTIESLTAYLHARQYLPFARMKELFNDVFNVAISEGGIHCLLNRFAKKTTPVYELIKQRVASSSVVGSDETGIKVNGNRNWFWTWQTPKATFIAHSSNRKNDTVKEHFPNGFPNSTLVHDGWKPQLNTLAKNHQSCLPHLQRQLNYLNEKYKNNDWSTTFLKLLYDALDLKKKMNPKNYIDNTQRAELIERLNQLLEKPPEIQHKELFTFYKRMGRERQHLFTFLFIAEVPADNNASERAIRNVKVKQKISGQFKIQQAAQNFAKIRSIIDTTIKNEMNLLEALKLIAKFEVQIKTD